MNTSAYFIQRYAAGANEAIEMAEAIEHNVDQDWDDEATLFTFEDGSVLSVCGTTVTAFANSDAARVEFPHAA